MKQEIRPASELAAQMEREAKRRHKYNARAVVIDGLRFASQAEGARYIILHQRQEKGEIRNLRLHPCFSLTAHGKRVGRYTADFEYDDDDGHCIEDVKGVISRDLCLRFALLRAEHGINPILVRLPRKQVEIMLVLARAQGRIEGRNG